MPSGICYWNAHDNTAAAPTLAFRIRDHDRGPRVNQVGGIAFTACREAEVGREVLGTEHQPDDARPADQEAQARPEAVAWAAPAPGAEATAAAATAA